MDNEMKSPTTNDPVDIDTYRKLVQTYLSMNLYSTALFWADKVATLSSETPKDIYWLAHCMFMLKQYHRASHIIQSRELEKNYIQCNYLVVKCLYQAFEYTEALKVLSSMKFGIFTQNMSTMETNSADSEGFFDDSPKKQVYSSIMLLKGHLLEATDNRGLAADCYRQALQYDVYCYEAFECLIKHQMLTAAEECELLQSLPIDSQCSKSDAAIIKMLYQSKLKKYHTVESIKIQNTPNINLSIPDSIISRSNETPITSFMTKTSSTPVSECQWSNEVVIGNNPTLMKLQESLDVVVAVAERLFYNCEYQKCRQVTEEILKKDPYHSDCLPVHIACLVELKESNCLFSLAHKLVDLYPDLAISWFTVGCYYYVIGKNDPARRYLSKATTLDKLFGPAWLAYGHSFAVDNEHDQAMAAYFKASQLMKGCHLPLMYIGLECGLTNNVKLAEKFFKQALTIAPDDPFIMHEVGVMCYQHHDFDAAEKHFLDAYNRIKSNQDSLMVEKWEPLLNNLGHTCRKLNKYEEALKYHHQALVLTPQNASTYSAIGFTYAMMGKAQEAVDWFHRALGLRRDDTFSTTMLTYVIEQLVDEVPAFIGCPDVIPDFSPTRTVKQEDTSNLDQTGENAENVDMSMSIEVSNKEMSIGSDFS